MRIVLLNGNTSIAVSERIAEIARAVAAADTEIAVATAPFGVPLVTSPEDNVLAAKAIERLAATYGGAADAVVVAISTDAGLAAAREATATPVLGMTEAALLGAALVARRIGMVVFGRQFEPVFRQLVSDYGLDERVVGVGVVEMTPEDWADPPATVARIADCVRRMVREAGVEAVVLTGAATAGLAPAVRAAAGVPVFDSLATAVRQAEVAARLS